MRGYRLRRTLRRGRDLIPPIRGGALVLMYHRVATPVLDPWRLAVSPDHLAEHLAILAASARPTTATGLLTMLDADRVERGTVAVTFDDGYADLASAVRPRLAASGVPATAFIVSGVVGSEREFWWDALERILLGPGALPESLELVVDGARHAWTLDESAAGGSEPVPRWRAWQPAPTRRHAVYRAVWDVLRRATPPARVAAMDDLHRWSGIPAEARPSHRPLTAAEFGALDADPLVEIGAHTMTHPSLAALAPGLQRDEVEGSVRDLGDRRGRPVQTFAYPFGGASDVSPATLGVARDAGVRAAFVTTPGLVRTSTDRHAIPRVFVDDLDGEGFARLLWRTAGIRAR